VHPAGGDGPRRRLVQGPSRDSPLFVNEAVLTRELAGLFPDHAPAPLAVDAERRWMALPDFGAELGWDAPVEVREDMLRTFARLQVRAAPQVDRLLGGRVPGPPAGLAVRPGGGLAAGGRGDRPARRDRRRDLAVGRRGGRAPGRAAPRGQLPLDRGNLDPPIDLHMMQSTAYWLRKVIAGLRRAAAGRG
jgi:hypothetical protein